MKTRVKICGVTRAGDALHAAKCGADAVGAVFIEGSPRTLSVSRVREVYGVLPPFVSRVGLFRNADPELVREVMREGGLSMLQFHGDETDGDCAEFGLPFVKVVNGDDRAEISDMRSAYPSAAGYCLDSVARGEGGTGKVFDWGTWPGHCDKPLILAGGLTPANVGDAIARLHPWGVDVSTGVEDGIKGEKCDAKVRLFINESNKADLRA